MRRAGPSRRAFIGGASLTLCLPVLEALLPRAARGQAVAAPRRFIGYFVPSGMVMQDWTPAIAGSDWEPPLLLEPLQPYQNLTTVLTGLRNTKQEDNLGDHAGGTGAFLTGRTVPRNQSVMGGPSIDQVIAQYIGAETAVPSLQLGGEGGDAAGSCDSGYPCAFANQISFSQAGVPLPKLTDPQQVFANFVAGPDPELSSAELQRRAALELSALDVILEEAAALQPKLSTRDRAKLDQYLESFRGVERRLQRVDGEPARCAAVAPLPVEGDTQLIQTMSDLMALTFSCDLTRVISFQWGNAASNRSYAFEDPQIVDGHHNISHHQSLPEKLAQLRTIDHWQVTQLAYLAGKLAEVEDVNGKSMLENSLLFFSSDISDGDKHNHDDMPVLLLGQGGGAISSGQHIVYDDQPWFANLFVSLAQALDVPLETFGENGDDPLEGLL